MKVFHFVQSSIHNELTRFLDQIDCSIISKLSLSLYTTISACDTLWWRSTTILYKIPDLFANLPLIVDMSSKIAANDLPNDGAVYPNDGLVNPNTKTAPPSYPAATGGAEEKAALHHSEVPVIDGRGTLNFSEIMKGTAAKPLSTFEKKAALINA